MTVLALDLGTNTGWAMFFADNIAYGTQVFKNDRYSGGGMRYLRFKRWLDEAHAAAKFSEIVFEEVRRHAGTDAAHVYGGFLAHLSAWCEENEVPYEGVPVGQIKKYWTGKGNAPKEKIIEEAKARGFSPSDDNAADALALLHMRLGV